MIRPHSLGEIPDDFVNEIQFEIDLCPLDMIELHLRRTIIDFCERSNYWQETATPIVVVSDTISYPVLTVPGIDAVCVTCVTDEEKEIELVRSSDPAVLNRYWQSSPSYIDLFPNDQLAGRTIHVDVAVRPVVVNEVFEVSTALLKDYRTGIIAGAKSGLYRIPKKSWTDLQQANIESNIFESLLNDARRYVGRGFSRMPDQPVHKNRPFY